MVALPHRVERWSADGELVWERRFEDEVLAIYQTEEETGNTRRVRVRIAEELQGAYPPEMLSPRAYFPIWQCIEEHLKRAG